MMYHSDIRIKIGDNWVPARDYQSNAFQEFLSKNKYGTSNPLNYNQNGIIFTIKRTGPHQGIFLEKENKELIPIADFANVKVFLFDTDGEVGWYPARNYQIFAYYHFLYETNAAICHYKSAKTNGFESHVPIKINNLDPNIIFSISR